MITTETISFTQIASFIAFVGVAFFLYRILVEQKEATIQTQKENISYLKDQLTEAKSRTPDVLAKLLADRIKLLEQELERTESSKTSTLAQIEAAKEELRCARQEADELREELRRGRELLDSVCSVCGAPLRELSYIYGTYIFGTQGEERDPMPHEHLVFDCGREVIDRDTWTKCGGREPKAEKSDA